MRSYSVGDGHDGHAHPPSCYHFLDGGHSRPDQGPAKHVNEVDLGFHHYVYPRVGAARLPDCGPEAECGGVIPRLL